MIAETDEETKRIHQKLGAEAQWPVMHDSSLIRYDRFLSSSLGFVGEQCYNIVCGRCRNETKLISIFAIGPH